MSEIKIGTVIPFVGPDAWLFSHHVELAKEFAARGHESELILTRPCAPADIEGVKIRSLRARFQLPFMMLRACRELDVISSHVHFEPAAIACAEAKALSALRLKHAKITYTVPGLFSPYPFSRMPEELDSATSLSAFGLNVPPVGSLVWRYSPTKNTSLLTVVRKNSSQLVFEPVLSEDDLSRLKRLPGMSHSVYRYTLRNCDSIVEYSPRLISPSGDFRSSDPLVDRLVKRVLSESYPASLGLEKKVSVIPNFVAVTDKRASGKKGRKRLVFAGRLTFSKGVDYAIRAVARLSRELPELELVIAGDGPAEKYLKWLVAELGLGKKVVFLGRIPNEKVSKAYLDSDAFVLCSTFFEGISRAALEAMALGLPVISTAVSGMPDAVINGKTGYLVGTDNLDELSAAFAKLFSDEGRLERMRAAAKQLVEDRFSVQAAADNYLRLYGRLV